MCRRSFQVLSIPDDKNKQKRINIQQLEKKQEERKITCNNPEERKQEKEYQR